MTVWVQLSRIVCGNSDCCAVKVGMLQGSVLRPLLFCCLEVISSETTVAVSLHMHHYVTSFVNVGQK